MEPISVEDMTPGMVIAEDIIDRNGRFLLGKGVTLSPKHLRVLKIWGITEARVEGVSESDVHNASTIHLNPDVLQKAAQSMRKRFRHANVEHEAMRELFRLCTFRKAQLIDGNDGQQEDESDSSRSRPASFRVSQLRKNPEVAVSPRELIHKEIKLPSLPNVFFQLNDAINDPRSSAKDIACIIENDTGLSAKLLRLANSPIYRFSSQVETISRAVTLIGTKEIGILALGITIMTCFRGIPADLIDMKSFWQHSVACGIAARVMASHRRMPSIERLFTAGLLHDVGRLVLYKYLPDEAGEALVRSTFDGAPLYENELLVFGISHSAMGGLLFKEWKLPFSLENTVKYHHKPMRAQNPVEPAIINMADIVANALGIGSGEPSVLPLDPDAWKLLGFSKSLFNTIIKQVDRQVVETARIFSDD